MEFMPCLSILSFGAACATGRARQRCSLGDEGCAVNFVGPRYGQLITEHHETRVRVGWPVRERVPSGKRT